MNKVVIEAYDPAWPQRFNELKLVLEKGVPNLIQSIEHVGSTSVPGLSAKPILDVDIVIDHRNLLPEVFDHLEKMGYYHKGDLGIEGREAFARVDGYVPWNGTDTVWMEHHLYVCSKESAELHRHVAFRDYLRNNLSAAYEYGELKKKLAASALDRTAYTDGKDAFVHSILNLAFKELDGKK